MANLNKVMLMGNITRELAMQYLPSNTPVVDFGIAVNRTWTGQDGVKKEEVTFVDCVAFGKQAEILAKFKKKGDPLFIEGRLKLDQWQAQDGTNRSKLRVIVENFQFLNRSQGQGQGGGYGGGGGEEGGYDDGAPAPAPRQAPQARAPMRQAARPAARPAPQQQPPADMDAPAPDELPPANQGDDIPF